MSNSSCARVLAILGGLIMTIRAIIAILSYLGTALDFSMPLGSGVNLLSGIIGAIVLLVIGILVLGRSYYREAVLLLILGILGILFGDLLGGILVIIAAVLYLV